MRIKRMLSELVDVPRMEEDKEGLLRGGFVMLKAYGGDGTVSNENCACNTCDAGEDAMINNKNCGCNSSCDKGMNANCDCNQPRCKDNLNCACGPTSAPKPTDPPKEPVSPMIAGFGLFF